jgi:hypothetical protein
MLSSVKYTLRTSKGWHPREGEARTKPEQRIDRNRTEAFVEAMRSWRGLHSIALVRGRDSYLTAGVLERRRHSNVSVDDLVFRVMER